METTGDRDDINVEQIMEKIRATIREKQKGGLAPPWDESPPESSPNGSLSSPGSLENELYFLTNNSVVQNNSYFISSHHPVIGTLLVKGRQVVHGEVRRYVDPVFARQTDFNAHNVRILKVLEGSIQALREEDARQETSLRSYRDEMSRSEAALLNRIREGEEVAGRQRALLDSLAIKQEEQIGQLRQDLREEYRSEVGSVLARQEELARETEEKIRVQVEGQMKDLVSDADIDIRNKGWLAGLLENRITRMAGDEGSTEQEIAGQGGSEVHYLAFEEQFRGPRESVKKTQAVFLPYFETCHEVLDIGCGRGEFLEILNEHGIRATGIDLDGDMVRYCQSRNLEVREADALSYLTTLGERSLDGIFIAQLVEHLEPGYLVKLLAGCAGKLKQGGTIVIETVNPLSFLSFANFYLDLTHKKPLHPETLKFLLQSVGFRDIEIRFHSYLPEEAKLRRLDIRPEFSDDKRRMLEACNYNVDMLNHVLWGPMDYAVIGKR